MGKNRIIFWAQNEIPKFHKQPSLVEVCTLQVLSNVTPTFTETLKIICFTLKILIFTLNPNVNIFTLFADG